ncbi:TetR/AcrR family transcriptional regulator [Listeria sp. PSOL-1]|uniref:TetR/AcrR family transcriptional regulator n=1 Tax=Listeria sp. PSOL-1 TaxID=1844999 RepID=UPI0013D48145|nr:TetR/AcrR family transcriptional regulator [Listeria sp. PSOL-1]
MKPQVTKNRIIEAAWTLLEEKGIAGFSMRKLAEFANMTVSSLYYHFKSKEVLFAELINQASAEIAYPVAERTWQERLAKYADNILVCLEKYPDLAQLLMDYPPTSRNYLKLLDNLLMIIDHLEMKEEEKFFAMNVYINYICTFKVDAERFEKTGTPFIADEKERQVELPFLSHYKEIGAYQSLDSKEMFVFGLKLILTGIEQSEKNR